MSHLKVDLRTSQEIIYHVLLCPALGSMTPGGSDSTDWRQALKLWNYCCRLAKFLLEEGLLDRHDFLTWIIELLDKRAPDDGLLR